jgi:hypothetical protein
LGDCYEEFSYSNDYFNDSNDKCSDLNDYFWGIHGQVVKVVDFKPLAVCLNPNKDFGFFHVE